MVKAPVDPVMRIRAPLAAAEKPANSADSLAGSPLWPLMKSASLPAIRASAAASPSWPMSAASTVYEAVCVPILNDQTWPASGVPDSATVACHTWPSDPLGTTASVGATSTGVPFFASTSLLPSATAE